MASIRQLTAVVGRDVTLEMQRYHVKAQLAQFVVLFLGCFWTAVAAAGFHVAGWAGLGSLVLAAFGAALRSRFPQLSLAALLRAVESAKPAGVSPLPAPTAPPHG